VLEIADSQLEPILARRSEPAVDAAWREGESMTVDEAVAYALADDGTDANLARTQTQA
jgi:hypothetical protein